MNYNLYFDWVLSISFQFEYMDYERRINIEDVEKDYLENVWRWRGNDLVGDDYAYVFELLGEKSDDGHVLVNDEMFMNVYDRYTKKLVKRITKFDIDICC